MQQLFDGLKAQATLIRKRSEVVESDNAFILCNKTQQHFRVDMGATLEIQCFHALHPYTSRASDIAVVHENNEIHFTIGRFEFVDHIHGVTMQIHDQVQVRANTPWMIHGIPRNVMFEHGFRWEEDDGATSTIDP